MREIAEALGLLIAYGYDAGEYAYHATTSESLPSIQHDGLVPQGRLECRDDEQRCTDEEVIFFSSEPRYAGAWGDVILRFPWPSDAEQDAYGEGYYVPETQGVSYTNWFTYRHVPPEEIEILVETPEGDTWEWLPDFVVRDAEGRSDA